MNLLYTFNDFYSNLSSTGSLFFWIIILLVILLIFLIVSLYMKNKKLTNLLKYNIMETKEEIEEDLPIIEKTEEIPTEEIKVEVEKVEEKENIQFEEKKEEPKENVPYSKNILREMNTRMQTSPIHIEKKDEEIIKESEYLTGIDYGEDAKSPLELMEDSYEVNDNMKFASEIVGRMEEEIKPSNIELTDYEKKQEEEAIISYDELLKVKDKIYNITEDEETDEFIDELKTFRLDLE